jgi:16S rRNA (adenine1518-N6/adenine1519-N6)-dimethyltransferase
MTKRKALGQHFLVRADILRKIIDVIDPHQDELIIEVGPGRGALTFPLAGRCGRLIAIEKDPDLIPGLLERKPENLVILEQDVLDVDFGDLLRRERSPGGAVKIVGNLPYSISSPFLFQFLAEQGPVSQGVFLLQKEVAERTAAGPGSKNRAPMSILFELDFKVRLRFTLPPGAFSPPPRVQSALVSFDKRESPLFSIEDREGFRRFLRAAFAERRKTLANNLRKLGLSAEAVKRSLAAVSLTDTIRAEQIDIGHFVELFHLLRKPGPLPESGSGGITQGT